MIAQVQRTFTGAEYDHVAMCLKYNIVPGKAELYMIESEATFGVSISKWSPIVEKEYYKLYDKITWRRLKADKSGEFFEKLKLFIDLTIGAKYDCNVKKLLGMEATYLDDS